ncbi:Muscleblind protein 3 [Paragonimus skrjabini miyazakii]|uniref:Muscleblind protein 3 n=1 Tax=Paragonimus skrjabini miyazakii TaxID=59628 RepID=A0A8S9YBZ0_9TREM|nr:Muscleblind protein 3 [Paragonimus skrjabini miyazakii]
MAQSSPSHNKSFHSANSRRFLRLPVILYRFFMLELRKNCKHSCCKYYHPPAHQIEAVLKRGDEQKKLLERQQRLLDTKVSTYLTMQPPSQSGNAFPNLSQAVCGSGLPWPPTNPLQPASVYGTYLTGGQTLPATLNPITALSTQFASVSDPNTSALFAAAAALQQQQQQTIVTPTLISVSPTARSSLVNGTGILDSCTTGHQSLNASSRSTQLPNVSTNGHHLGLPPRVVTGSEYHPLPPPSSGLVHQILPSFQSQIRQTQQIIAAAIQVAMQSRDLVSSANVRTTTAAVLLPPGTATAAFEVGSMPTLPTSSFSTGNLTSQPPSSSGAALASSSTNHEVPTMVNTTLTKVVRAGMKREAVSVSSDACGVGLDLHSWYPSKRFNCAVTYPSESVGESELVDGSNGMYNGNGSHTGSDEQRSESELQTACSECPVTLTPGLPFSSSYCGTYQTPHFTTSGMSGMLNPVNLYGLPFSTGQAMASSYLPAQQLAYPSIYQTQGTPDSSNSLATLALNNWLVQHSPAHQLLHTQVPVSTQTQSNPALMAAFTALHQQHQQASPELAANPQSIPFAFQQQQQQQQQALILSLFLRAQQSQLAAAQMAAAAQASGVGGLLHTNSSSRPSVVGPLTNSCILDSTYSLPGTLGGLSTNPYAPAIPCVQNPITNVAYINDKGHLLETLPICRDFKAGKCHRNADCRYVHLIDENVEVNQGRVIVCRDAAKGRCTRVPCKYYHVPLLAISANRSLALNSVLATATVSSASQGQ